MIPCVAIGQSKLEGTGTVMSINGDCPFRQSEERKVIPYMMGLKGRDWMMHFDDPDCLPEAGDSSNNMARFFDRKQIAITISRILRGPIVNVGVRYDVETFHGPGDMENSGV